MPGNKSKTQPKVTREGRYGRFKARKRLRMISVKVPGGRTNIQFRKKKPSKSKCSKCGEQLSGVPKELPSKLKKLAKTKRRPERPYGGVLCSPCTRLLLKEKARVEK